MMFKALSLAVGLVVVALVLFPRVTVALSWLLVLLILLMAADLLRSYWRAYRRRTRRA